MSRNKKITELVKYQYNRLKKKKNLMVIQKKRPGVPSLSTSRAQIAGGQQKVLETKEEMTRWRRILDELEKLPKYKNTSVNRIFHRT